MSANRFGNIVAATATSATSIIFLSDLTVEYNGVYDLYNSRRNVLARTTRLGNIAIIGCIGITLEYVYVTFTAV